VNSARSIYFWMISSFITMAAFSAHATTVNYTLDNVILVDGEQMTGTFDWTYSVGDFEGGSGVFTALEIPWRPGSTAPPLEEPGMVFTIENNQIEISLDGNFHDYGLDISLKFEQPLSPTQSSPIDTDPNKSFFECCGNGFKDQPFQSGRIIPSTFLVGDFDVDGDTDGWDFLKWQRGEVSSPPSASDLAAWEANFGTVTPLLAASAAVPEPSGALMLLAGIVCVGMLRSKPHVLRSIATLAILTSFFAAAESEAAVERYKIEADYLVRLAELGHNTVIEGFESSTWDVVRSPDVNNRHSLPEVLSQGLIWEGAASDVFGPLAFDGVTTNYNWARTGQWGLYEDRIRASFFSPLYQSTIRVSSAAPLYGVGGWFDTNPDGESVGFLFEDRTTANAPGYVLPGFGAMYPGDNPSFGHEFIGIVDPDGFNSVVLTGSLEVNEEGVLEGGTIYGADDFTFAVGSVATADFDNDGDVDSADLVVWESSFGSGAGADADADGHSDGADFLAWQRQFTGDLSPPLLAATTLPEPSNVVLLITLMATRLIYRRRK